MFVHIHSSLPISNWLSLLNGSDVWIKMATPPPCLFRCRVSGAWKPSNLYRLSEIELSSFVSVSASICMLFIWTNCCSSSILLPAVMLFMLICAKLRVCCFCDCSRGPGFVSIPLTMRIICMSMKFPILSHDLLDIASSILVWWK